MMTLFERETVLRDKILQTNEKPKSSVTNTTNMPTKCSFTTTIAADFGDQLK